jgi:hypothetical protein
MLLRENTYSVRKQKKITPNATEYPQIRKCTLHHTYKPLERILWTLIPILSSDKKKNSAYKQTLSKAKICALKDMAIKEPHFL